MNNKFAIGCLVQWYEVEMFNEYVQSLVDSLKYVDSIENIFIDFTLVINQDLEKIDDSISMDEIVTIFNQNMMSLSSLGWKVTSNNLVVTDDLISIADYRRKFNEKYCDEVDVLIWGESDSLLPKEMFIML